MPRGIDAAVLERRRLHAAQSRAGLDQGEMGRRQQGWLDLLQGADDILRQRAPARSDFGDHRPRRLAEGPPDRDEPDADQFAEHLADLRGGGEIAVAPERIPAHVIAVPRVGQTQCEVIRDADRPGGAKSAPRCALSAPSCCSRLVRRPRRRHRPDTDQHHRQRQAPCPWSASRRKGSRVAGPARGRIRQECASMP